MAVILAMVLGAVDTGWTFYTPYSTTTDGTGDADDDGGVRARVLVDFHGNEFHRHRA